MIAQSVTLSLFDRCMHHADLQAMPLGCRCARSLLLADPTHERSRQGNYRLPSSAGLLQCTTMLQQVAKASKA